MTRRLIFFLSALFSAAVPAYALEKKLTILIYLATNHEASPYVGFNCRQLELEGSPKQVNVLLCMSHYSGPGKYKVGLHVLEGHTIVQKEAKRVPRVTEEEVLGDALAWAATYPAEQFGLIIWSQYPSHTNGAVGVRLDSTNARFLSDRALQQVLETSGHKIDFLGLDGSCTATLELAFALKSHVRYLVASGQSQKTGGWPYHELLKAFKRSSKEVRPLTQEIVHAFGDYYRLLMTEHHLACFDLKRIDAVAEQVRITTTALRAAASNYHNRRALNKCLARVEQWKEGGYVDMGDWYRKILSCPLIDAQTRQASTAGLQLAKQCTLASVIRNGRPKQLLGLRLPTLSEQTRLKGPYQASLWVQDSI